MEFDFIWIGLGIAVAGFFIGEGLKNFNNPEAKSLFDSLDDVQHGLIKENEVHDFMGISKEDAKTLIDEYPDIPHIKINKKVYYPKEKLRKWLMEIGNNNK
ncbi:helix-turn-helix domain-containing protein [Oceanobacillus halophilus]|uniref:DNA-binding protein n=1 Tax=Oceanobacillus halophilus TaxID=930130 RepID=A0A495A071_9BACI|nr:helix-turn-helix domain-containing protein [Oceanobacillus halophilus]RKQ32670.1 DNA-binding protein [Oceanobacillus halophilus]